jgi:hypothetical protein
LSQDVTPSGLENQRFDDLESVHPFGVETIQSIFPTHLKNIQTQQYRKKK